jgi:hypothetical protein
MTILWEFDEIESIPIGTTDYFTCRFELYPDNNARVPHISLVFREMWDTTALNPKCPSGMAKRSLRKNRFALHRKVHRTSDETLRVSVMVQRMRLGLIDARR